MIAKVFAALLTLNLALAPGCNSGGGEGKAPATAQPSPSQPAAATNSSAAANGPATPGTTQPEGVASPATAGAKSDACRLLTSQDIEAVQGEALKEAKGSEQTSGALVVAQCFYATPSFNKSVSLTLTKKNAASSEPGGPREFWKRQFGGEKEREKRREEKGERDRDKDREREAEEEGEIPAQPVKGLGDEAYWVGNQKVGVLYVLKGDRFLRVSIGGPEEQQTKIEKMKELAKRALKRL